MDSRLRASVVVSFMVLVVDVWMQDGWAFASVQVVAWLLFVSKTEEAPISVPCCLSVAFVICITLMN